MRSARVCLECEPSMMDILNLSIIQSRHSWFSKLCSFRWSFCFFISSHFPSFGVYGVYGVNGVYGMCLCISSSKIMLYVTVCVILLCWTKSVSAFDITNVQESGSSLNVIDHSIWGNRQYWGFENMICKFSLSFSHSLFFFCTPELLPKQ